MARILLTAAPWTYREIRFPDGQTGLRAALGEHVFRAESTINGKMPFWSLLYLAAWLRQEGHEVSYLESYGTPDDVWFRELEVFDPDIIGFNSVTCTWPKTRQLMGKVKELWPDKLIVLGGSHTNVAKEAVLEDCAALDLAVFGEGEEIIADIAAQVDAGTRDWASILGLAYREQGQVIRNGKRALMDVRRLPFPARDLMRTPERYNPRLNIYNRPNNTILFTGRGCPLTCASCHLPATGGLKFRIKSPQQVYDEIAWCQDQMGISDFGFYDHFGIFSSDEAAAMEFCELILRSGRQITFTVTFWSYDFTDALLDLMKRAGCWRIDTVLISGVQKNLRKATMGSPLTVEQTESGVRRVRAAGMEVAARFSLGIDGETVEEARATIDFACSLPLEWAFFTPVNPVFGSRLWRQLDKADQFRQDERSMNIFNVFYEPTSMTHAELKSLQREAYRRFYGRPRFVLDKLKYMRDPGGMRRNLTVASHLSRHIAGF